MGGATRVDFLSFIDNSKAKVNSLYCLSIHSDNVVEVVGRLFRRWIEVPLPSTPGSHTCPDFDDSL